MMVSTNTIWIEWDKTTADAAGTPVGEEGGRRVIYYLWMRPGFYQLVPGQEVMVIYNKKPRTAPTLASMSGSQSQAIVSSANSSVASGSRAGAEVKFHAGVIKKVHKDRFQGLFDVVYSDGVREYKVPRHRIRPRSLPKWELVYVGEDTHYEAQGVVPENVLYQDSGDCLTAVECSFALQTQFTEYCWDAEREVPVPCAELSHMSSETLVTTRQITEEERRPANFGRRFKEAIELDNEVTLNVSSGITFDAAGTSKRYN